MFSKIYLFELQNGIRRPALYLYFSAVLILTTTLFATGSLPVGEKEHINSPYLITFLFASMTMFMMLISSSIMGTALFRDIEYQTKDYYLTYPITRNGYFWGRFLGAFTLMLLIALAIPAGILIGSYIGPIFGKTVSAQYGPNALHYYIQPFFVFALPNLFFTAALFFGLVAVFRNVKVIYFGGILLFLFYFIALFFLNHTRDITLISLSDPFGTNGIRFQMNNASTDQHNHTMISLNGPLGWNRLLWSGAGLAVLLTTYLRFNFENFFAGKRDRAAIDETVTKSVKVLWTPPVDFSAKYERATFRNITKLELLNIIRDNYFWVIVGAGAVFLSFVLWLGDRHNGVQDLPRTVILLGNFADGFPFFIFFVIMFYTGETLHRDRTTRYAFISDALPPPNRVMNGAKLVSMLILATGLSLVPMILGMTVQLLQGFMNVRPEIYLTYIGLIYLPKLLSATVFCYFFQVILNNKFGAYALAIALWILMFFMDNTGEFDYHLLVYSYTPKAGLSDMDGLGHMAVPTLWFDLYWLLAAGLLVIFSSLFYNRGLNTSFKDRLRLLPERFDRRTKITSILLLIGFMIIGGYIYYNVSYLNEYLTKEEKNERAVLFERVLKRFEYLPIPKVTAIKMNADLYPAEKKAIVSAIIHMVNKNDVPIREMLLGGDELTDFSISLNGHSMPYTSPLVYKRGIFNGFRPATEASGFRLYHFEKPLLPGDSATLALRSSITYTGFRNGLFATDLLSNGTLFKGGLPELGYNEDDELSSPYERKKAGLPQKTETDIAQDDPRGVNMLKSGPAIDLLSLDLTISTDGDQTAVTGGNLVSRWSSKGRNYCRYIQKSPGMYMPFAISSARYAVKTEVIKLDHPVAINIYYHPEHYRNVERYLNAYKDALKYYSSVYGAYPLNSISLAEGTPYAPGELSTGGFDMFNELYGWQAKFTDPNQFDYLHSDIAYLASQQWWRYQVTPNNTIGSLVIPEGLARYDALVMSEKKYGKANMRDITSGPLGDYLWRRKHSDEPENPVIRSNMPMLWGYKTGTVLYGLRQLLGGSNVDAALLEFKNRFVYRASGRFAGARDLYSCLAIHTPDSLQYYLKDSWRKVVLYDNKIISATARPTGKTDEYRVQVNLIIGKTEMNDKGEDLPVKNIQDYLDIGVYGSETKNSSGRNAPKLLSTPRLKLKGGKQELSFIVKGKPTAIAIDPLAYLIDKNSNDNWIDIK